MMVFSLLGKCSINSCQLHFPIAIFNYQRESIGFFGCPVFRQARMWGSYCKERANTSHKITFFLVVWSFPDQAGTVLPPEHRALGSREYDFADWVFVKIEGFWLQWSGYGCLKMGFIQYFSQNRYFNMDKCMNMKTTSGILGYHFFSDKPMFYCVDLSCSLNPVGLIEPWLGWFVDMSLTLCFSIGISWYADIPHIVICGIYCSVLILQSIMEVSWNGDTSQFMVYEGTSHSNDDLMVPLF